MTFNSIQDFINDSVAVVNISAATPGNGVRATQTGLFAQDTYQIRPNLTIDYSLAALSESLQMIPRPPPDRTIQIAFVLRLRGPLISASTARILVPY